MHFKTRLVPRAALAALTAVTALSLGACGKANLPGGGSSLPSKPSSLDNAPSMPSGEVDPNTCGNYAAVDAGRKLKVFLQATKDLDTATIETAKVVKQSCIMMGQELGMPGSDLEGETKDICDKVIATYQGNLKVSLKAKAKLTVKYKPAVCTVDAQLQAKAGAECSGGATAGTGGSGAGGQCAAAAKVKASLAVQCTEPELTISADAKLALDKSKLEMTLKALRDGLPKLLSIKARMEPIEAATQEFVRSASELAAMGPKFTQSFADQATCIGFQLSAVAKASTRIQANVSVSVSVSASASASAGG
jgi:hypothetical protein